MKGENNTNSKKGQNQKLDNLINLVENHTRTERHLEQYSHIGNPDNIERARDKQNLREKQINEIKSQILNHEDKAPTEDEIIKNFEESYKLGVDYLEDKEEHIDSLDVNKNS